MKSHFRNFLIVAAGALVLCGCRGSKAEQILSPNSSPIEITEVQLAQQCKEIEAKWDNDKSIAETLAWLEKTMKEYDAEYAFQKPTVVGRAVYYFEKTGESSLTHGDLNDLGLFVADLNPQIPADRRRMVNKSEHLEEAAYLYNKYGVRGGTPEQINNHQMRASLGLERKYFEQFWENQELNMPPKYIGELLNEQEGIKPDGQDWRFTRSEWREWFTYIYSAFLEKDEGWENALYLNYVMGFSANRNHEGKLENVRLEKIECKYPTYTGLGGLGTLMPPAISPKYPIEPFLGGSCYKYQHWLGCHKIKNEYEERKFKTKESGGCKEIPKEEPVCLKGDM